MEPTKKIKILQVIGGGEIGGAERHLLTLMRLLDRDRFETELLCLCDGPFAALARAEGIVTHEIPMRHKLDLGTVGPIKELLASRGIQLVHTHGVRANLVARTAANRAGLPVITTFHSVLRYDYPTAWEARVAGVFTRLTNRFTGRFIAVSEAVKNDLIRLGVTPDRIDVVYNGLDFSKLLPRLTPEEVRSRLGIPTDRRLIGCIGRLHPVKGQITLLDAARELLKTDPDLLFLIVGEGPHRPLLEARLRELGLEEQVIMPGYYDHVSDLYPLFSAFCLPSVMEGMPLVLLEAMHFGVPIAASDTGGIPELIQNRENGLLFSPGNPHGLAAAVRELLNDPTLKSRCVDAGRETALHYTIQAMVRNTEKVYEPLIRKK